ncbi:hypothetical protein HDV02_000688 [Globomyces sp. JEL0801]|nr:hypothetical protein HDV02_000688 [Globomyces sp. JEL0801]
MAGLISVTLTRLVPNFNGSIIYSRISLPDNPFLSQLELDQIVKDFNDLYSKKGPSKLLYGIMTVMLILSFVSIVTIPIVMFQTDFYYIIFLPTIMIVLTGLIRQAYYNYTIERFRRYLADLCITMTNNFRQRRITVRIDNEHIAVTHINSGRLGFTGQFTVAIDIMVSPDMVPQYLTNSIMTQMPLSFGSPLSVYSSQMTATNLAQNRYSPIPDHPIPSGNSQTNFPEYQILQLTSTGVSRERAIETLTYTKGDFEKAMNILRS